MDRETKLMKELATAAIRWFANQNDAQLAERIEALCNRFGRSDLLYSTPPRLSHLSLDLS